MAATLCLQGDKLLWLQQLTVEWQSQKACQKRELDSLIWSAAVCMQSDQAWEVIPMPYDCLAVINKVRPPLHQAE